MNRWHKIKGTAALALLGCSGGCSASSQEGTPSTSNPVLESQDKLKVEHVIIGDVVDVSVHRGSQPSPEIVQLILADCQSPTSSTDAEGHARLDLSDLAWSDTILRSGKAAVVVDLHLENIVVDGHAENLVDLTALPAFIAARQQWVAAGHEQRQTPETEEHKSCFLGVYVSRDGVRQK